MNQFVEKTAEILNLDLSDPLLAPRGFDMGEDDDNGEPCVLIMGLNPAGNESDADREANLSKTYFYGIPGVDLGREWVHNQYFVPILKFVNDIMNGNAKWHWCKKPWQKIEQELNATPHQINAVRKFYNENCGSIYTIYIGDMFYYHETKSKKLPLNEGKNGPNYHKYCMEMLEAHIHAIRKNNKDREISFIYINNAKVSHWLCNGDESKTSFVIQGVRVFLGGMLSGQRRMDTFSTNRLKGEIRQALEAEKNKPQLSTVK